MFFYGSFVNLLWDESSIEEHHESNWHDLHTNYGLSANSPPASTSGKEEVSLYDLASSCVSQCSELLFSLMPCENIVHGTTSQNSSSTLCQYLTNDMQKLLHCSLCDHLIVSFAFRFFCENLSPEKLYPYSRTFFNCLGILEKKWPFETDKQRIKVHKNDFYKSIQRKYHNFCKTIGLQFPLNTDSSQDIFESEVARDPLLSHFVSELGEKEIPPPYAWFLLFAIEEDPLFRKVLADKKADRLYSLYKWIGDSDYSRVLLDCDICKNMAGVPTLPDFPVIIDNRGCSFTCIPSESVSPTRSAIPDMRYNFKELKESAEEPKESAEEPKESVVITSRLQKVFNNYLFEQKFHLHSLATAEAYLKQFHLHSFATAEVCFKQFRWSSEDPFYNARELLKPLKLYAPLVHSSFISCLSGKVGLREIHGIIKPYIDRWNNIALPALEELFIWSVWTHMPSRANVVEAINKWISCDATYNRLNIIRIGQADKVAPISYNNSLALAEDMKTLHNKLIDLIWK